MFTIGSQRGSFTRLVLDSLYNMGVNQLTEVYFLKVMDNYPTTPPYTTERAI